MPDTCAFCEVPTAEHPEPLCSPGVVRELRAEMERLRADLAVAVQRAGQARADADRKIADIRDATDAELERLRGELTEAKRVIAAQPKPSAVEELRETIAEILDNSDETAVDAFLYFAAAEVARIAGGEMTARWQAVAERDAAHATLLHFAAEAHRRKWAHEGVNPAAFDALHRLGNELHAALDAPSAPESQETTDGHA